MLNESLEGMSQASRAFFEEAKTSHTPVALYRGRLRRWGPSRSPGRVRGLAVTSATRSHALPDLPTVGDFVPGYEASAFFAVGAPKNTPAEIINKLNTEINAGLADPKIRARLADLGGMIFTGSPADFGKFIAEETDKWAKVIKSAGIKPE